MEGKDASAPSWCVNPAEKAESLAKAKQNSAASQQTSATRRAEASN